MVANLAIVGVAGADRRTDMQGENAEYKLDDYDANKPTDWFDGKVAKPGTDPARALASVEVCLRTAGVVKQMLTETPGLVTTKHGKDVPARLDALNKYCATMQTVANAVGKQAAGATADKATADKAEADREARRAAWRAAAQPYSATIATLAPYFDPTMPASGFSDGLLDQMRSELPKVAKICQQFPDLVDPPHPRNDAMDRPVVVCKMAAGGIEPMVKLAHHGMIMTSVEINNGTAIQSIKDMMSNPDKQIDDDTQKLVYDHDGWVKDRDAFYKPIFGKNGESVPADIYKPVEAMVPELKAFIDKVGTTNKFEMSPHQDAAAQKLVIAKLAATRPNATVVKIGSDYVDWVAYDEKTFVKSDSTYDYYRVSKGKDRYKRGWMLVKFKDRPYCQAREWIVHRVYNGTVAVDWLAQGGLFVKCD